MPATDYTRTNNPRSLHLAEMAIPFPEWIQGSPIPSAPEFEKLASAAFADPGGRRLPVSTKEATFFSAIDYFANVASYPESTFEAIKSASDWFGIGEDVAAYAELFAANMEKAASDEAPVAPSGRFAITTRLSDQDFQVLPINSPMEISKSAADLVSMVNENRIHYLMFVDASREIVKAAGELGSDESLPAIVIRAGSERFPDFEKAARMIGSRLSPCRNHEGAYESYTSAIADAEKGTITADECMQKIAAIDDALGIHPNYSVTAKIPLPHLVVFGGPSMAEVEKAASETLLIRGVALPLSAIEDIPAIQIDYKMSKSAAADLTSLLVGRDARPISLAIEKWDESDQKAILRLAVAHSPA